MSLRRILARCGLKASGLQQLFAKNQELERLLKESCDEGNKARKLVELLEAKVVDLQRQANQLYVHCDVSRDMARIEMQ